jgi:hypothetical protein
LACGFAASILFLIFNPFFINSNDRSILILPLSFGIGLTFLLEKMIITRKLFYSGIDNALLYNALSAFSAAIFIFFEPYHLTTWVQLLLFLPFLIIVTIRYSDSVICTLMFFLTIAIIIAFTMNIEHGKRFLPFVIMLFSGSVYPIISKLYSRPDYLYYQNCLDILKTLCLITFYLGGNYFIVREGNAMLSGTQYSASTQIDFAVLFYGFTSLIPMAYMGVGLKNKNRLWLIIGMLCMGFSIFTYRHYFGILPTDIALILAGALIIVGSVVAIYFLKKPIYGFTYEADTLQDELNLDSLLISEVVSNRFTPQTDSFKFGGGNSGGGGAGGEY